MSANVAKRFWREPLDKKSVPRIRGKVSILEERCKGCQYCVEFCPCGVLSHSQRYNTKGYHPPDVGSSDECLACKLCELLCPEFAIIVESVDDSMTSNPGGSHAC